MEEMHRIHKEVPFGYWVLWVEPAFRALRRKWRERRALAHRTHDRVMAMR
ncbi:MAG: hypothetical protein JF588_10710 [Caulobacterales bacterium]|nr:hypothetical protein [Caulobacterales bacterium]